MLKYKSIFSSFSVSDIAKAKKFFENILGLEVEDGRRGIYVKIGKDQIVLVYPKVDHQPAAFTVLNLHVENLEEAMEELSTSGIEFMHYGGLNTNEQGIRMNEGGPNVAWFQDPFGNVMSVMEHF